MTENNVSDVVAEFARAVDIDAAAFMRHFEQKMPGFSNLSDQVKIAAIVKAAKLRDMVPS